MNYIVLDLEWNSVSGMKDTPINDTCPNEIIQIGAVKVDAKNKTIIDEFNRFIKPTIYNNINPRIEKLTNISYDDLKEESGFLDVIKEFKDWTKNGFILISWGRDDIRELKRNIKYHDDTLLDNWLSDFLNLQNVYTKYVLKNCSRQSSLIKAIKKLKIDLNDTLHNALVDAKYTSKILLYMIDKKLITREDFEYIGDIGVFNEDIIEIEFNEELIIFQCPSCGRFIKKNGEGVIYQGIYICEGYCKQCNENFTHKISLCTKNEEIIENSKK